MKKLLIALSMLVASATSMAQNNVVQIGYKYQDTNSNAGANGQGYNFLLGSSLNKNVAADIYSESFFTEGNGANATRLETGLTGKTDIATGLIVYTRVAVGQKFIPGSNFTYYSVEPGVKYALTDKLAVKASFRFRNAVDTDNNDTSRTQTVGAEYALGKTRYVSAGVSHITGDGTQNGNQFVVAYGVRF